MGDNAMIYFVSAAVLAMSFAVLAYLLIQVF
jgi:hypothetical protein